MSRWLHAHIQPGSVVEAAAPRGDFYLTDGRQSSLLISAGIGVTPVLAMLHALSAAHSDRDIWWLHTARNRETQVFATEVTSSDRFVAACTTAGVLHARRTRLNGAAIAALGLPTDADAYLCGPTQFMTDMRDALTAVGLDLSHVHSELFGALPPINPGIVDARHVSRRTRPTEHAGTGPSITFAAQRADGQLVDPITAASSTSPKPATCRPGSPVEAGSVTSASPGSLPGRRSTSSRH